MSKIGNAISVLKLLENNKKMSCRELAEKVEVTERMVRKYISDLQQAGIYIESINGRNGGYILNKKAF